MNEHEQARKENEIELWLLDLSQLPKGNGESIQKDFQTFLDEQVFAELPVVATASSTEQGVHRTKKNLAEETKDSLLKYVKTTDRLLALGSLLLKSQAYSKTKTEQPLTRALYLLPRTSAGKPYIHRPGIEGEVPELSFSLSHQWPFVGLARRVMERVNQLPETSVSGTDCKVGCDVVAFDKPNPKLYGCVEEFIDVFRSYLSDSEWFRITRSTDTLREFYVHWAVKEAYSKALGFGMGTSFGEFGLSWDLLPTDSLWDMLSTQGQITLNGKVCSSGVRSNDCWSFHFLCLPEVGSNETIGAVCICVGPTNEKISVKTTAFRIDSWSDLAGWQLCSTELVVSIPGVLDPEVTRE